MVYVTRHTSHVTRHTSHVTRHTSHVTRHTSHLTPHTSQVNIVGLQEKQVVSEEELLNAMDAGNVARYTRVAGLCLVVYMMRIEVWGVRCEV
jgi:hypothetical protein